MQPIHGFPTDTLGTFITVIEDKYDGFVQLVDELDDKPYNIALITSANTMDAITMTIPEIIDLLREDDPEEFLVPFKALALKACHMGEIDIRGYYKAELEARFDWDGVVEDAKDNREEGEGRCYLGSVLNLTPSGKIYAFWTSNQTDADVILDEAWNEALGEIAEEKGGFIDFEDCSVFFSIVVEDEED